MTEEFDPEVKDCLHRIAIGLDTLNRHMLSIVRILEQLREEERDGD